jgi:hypothetical protein
VVGPVCLYALVLIPVLGVGQVRYPDGGMRSGREDGWTAIPKDPQPAPLVVSPNAGPN